MKKIGDGGVAQSVRASLKAAKSNHKVDSLMPILGIITERAQVCSRKIISSNGRFLNWATH